MNYAPKNLPKAEAAKKSPSPEGAGKKTRATDRRVRKTKALLRHCLAELLKTKRVQDITVKELTEMSDLNRGTFYLHYKDVFDLLSQTENELIEEFDLTLNKFNSETVKERPSVIFEEVFKLIKDNSEIVGILLGKNGDINFLNRLKDIVRNKCLKDFMEDFKKRDPEHFDVYYNYIINGCIGIVQYWLTDGLKEEPSELAATTEEIVFEGIRGRI